MEDIKAIKLFKSGTNCAQSVFAHFSEKTGIKDEEAIKLSTGFGSGMGRMQEICGALSGGILVLSSVYGKDKSEYNSNLLYDKIQQMFTEFNNKYETNKCFEILGKCNLRTAEGQVEFKEKNKIEICYGCVEKVVSTLNEIC